MIPRILLIGCGKFGKNHLRILKELDASGRIVLYGVVTATVGSANQISEESHVSAFADLTDDLLKKIDAAVIVTPPSTHYNIAQKCIKYCSLFVEKPLALTLNEIDELHELSIKYSRKIMVGHIYRFNNSLIRIKELLKTSRPSGIKIKVTGGIPSKDIGIIFEYMHAFDILDFLFEEVPQKIACKDIHYNGKFEDQAIFEVTLSHLNAEVELSWINKKKERSITLDTNSGNFFCDLISQTIIYNGIETKYTNIEPLRAELDAYMEVLNGKNTYPGVIIAKRVAKIINMAYDSLDQR